MTIEKITYKELVAIIIMQHDEPRIHPHWLCMDESIKKKWLCEAEKALTHLRAKELKFEKQRLETDIKGMKK